ncbi:MAG TPA: hypothetical protein VFX70_11320 [Mycobacteriales bacterium]|nr:hypothetical protein [Mycobacteriales bacterium]
MRNALISVALVMGVVFVATSGAAQGWLALLVLGAGMFWVLSASNRRGAPQVKSNSRAGSRGAKAAPAGSPWPVRAARWAGRTWRAVRTVGRIGKAGAHAGAVPARRAWDLRKLWWKYGPGHRALTLRCRYCRHRSRTADEALAHADTHVHDYDDEMTRGQPPADPDPPPPAPDTRSDPEPAETPDAERKDTMTAPEVLGTAGRAVAAGTVMDWSTSQDARRSPEMFAAWLRAQAIAHRHLAGMVPDLVRQYHGRGPSGHAGVPEAIVAEFTAAWEESQGAIAAAFERWAARYAAHVDEAEHDLTQRYGREVLASATSAHRGQ